MLSSQNRHAPLQNSDSICLPRKTVSLDQPACSLQCSLCIAIFLNKCSISCIAICAQSKGTCSDVTYSFSMFVARFVSVGSLQGRFDELTAAATATASLHILAQKWACTIVNPMGIHIVHPPLALLSLLLSSQLCMRTAW